MSDKPKSLLAGGGALISLTVAAVMLLGVSGPSSAQFFNFGGFQQPAQQRSSGWFGGGWFGNETFAPFHRREPQPRWDRRRASAPVREDFSKAPSPEKRDTAAKRNVLVLGDAMADWLAFGLEDVYTEQPDMGVIRKAKANSGLIQYQPKGTPADWMAAARSILAVERPDVIVVMLGLNDRISLREPVVEKSDKDKSDKEKKTEKNGRKPDAKSTDSKPGNDGDAAARPDNEPAADSELPQDAEAPAPEKVARSPDGIYQFQDHRWVELYEKKIDEMITVVKSKGVPVVWVGLPAISGQKSTADVLFLDALYRDAAGRAGITYVDIWDGFVDETGRFMQKGPDFEGQIRQLRTDDGVYFTKPGARKLAQYVEREITRLLAARSGPIGLPTEPATPESKLAPGQRARPLAGPIVPLVAPTIASDQLLGGRGTPPSTGDELADRVMMKGEPLSPPAGRADDFTWPRREVEQDKSETPVALAAPVGLRDVRAQAKSAESLKPKKHGR